MHGDFGDRNIMVKRVDGAFLVIDYGLSGEMNQARIPSI